MDMVKIDSIRDVVPLHCRFVGLWSPSSAIDFLRDAWKFFLPTSIKHQPICIKHS